VDRYYPVTAFLLTVWRGAPAETATRIRGSVDSEHAALRLEERLSELAVELLH